MTRGEYAVPCDFVPWFSDVLAIAAALGAGFFLPTFDLSSSPPGGHQTQYLFDRNSAEPYRNSFNEYTGRGNNYV